MKIPLYAENYEENDGTIAGSPNLQKVVVFDEILLKKINCCADLDSQVLIFEHFFILLIYLLRLIVIIITILFIILFFITFTVLARVAY